MWTENQTIVLPDNLNENTLIPMQQEWKELFTFIGLNHKCAFKLISVWIQTQPKSTMIHTTTSLPGWTANCHISSTELRDFSWGAWSTIIVDPTIQRRHPSIPIFCSFSPNMKCAKTALAIHTQKQNQLKNQTFKIQKAKLKLGAQKRRTFSPNNNTQSTKWSNKHRRGINVGNKIRNLANNHCENGKPESKS